MFFLNRSSLAAIALLGFAPASASAATLRFTLTNLAPADSFAFAPTYFNAGAQDLSDVIFTPSGTGMETLPQLGFFVTLDASAAVFPPPGGGTELPLLLPGEQVTFTLSGVELLGENTLRYGAGLFGLVVAADPAGRFTGLDLTLTAGAIAPFESVGGGASRLVLPDSISPGPASVSSTTPVLRLTVVPEPSAAMLTLAGFALALRRTRR